VIGVDANVLIYAINRDHPASDGCEAVLRGVAGPDGAIEPVLLPWSVVYEFLRVVTHPRVLRAPLAMDQAWGFVEDLMARDHVHVVAAGSGHASVAARVLAAPGVRGNLVHDAHIAAVLVEHGVRRISTRDQDFRRFPRIEVVDPLA
jgi:uncharacterized protein